MAEIEVGDDDVTVRLRPSERFWALHRGDVRVRRSDITGVTTHEDVYGQVRGLRAPGLAIPGRVRMGTWRGRHGKDFVVARRGQPGVVISLADSAWSRLVVGLDTRAAADLVATTMRR